jgi:hypothetical protein
MPSRRHRPVELIAAGKRGIVRFRCDCGFQAERRLDRFATGLEETPSGVLFL